MRLITKYVANDGSEFTDELACRYHEVKSMHGEAHQCPKCLGRGVVQGEPIIERVRDYISESYQGMFARPEYMNKIVGYESVPCNVCGGGGYTATLKLPVTKTTIVGWE